MKTLSALAFIMAIFYHTKSQNINYEWVNVALCRLPLKPLQVTTKSYSCSIQDLGEELASHQIKNLENALAIPGFTRSEETPSVKLELIINPLSVTNQEIKDDPFTTEKDGVKTVHHNYHYLLTCSFPAKLRVAVSGGQITEQDLPGFFQTKYYGRQAATETALQTQWEKDYSFLKTLQEEQVSERVKELKEIIFNLYGYGMHPQFVKIGYVKDKKGEYEDLTKAMALTRDAFLYASNKEIYMDDVFKAKTNEATIIFEKALTESSEDKKARINNRVAGMIYYNLALISFGLNDFDKAKDYVNKIHKASNNTEVEAGSLLNKTKDQQKRFIANSSLESKDQGAPERPTPPQLSSGKPESEQWNYIVGKKLDTLNVRFIIPSSTVMPYGDTVWIQDKVIVFKDGDRTELYPDDLHGFFYKGTYWESLWWVKDMKPNSPWTIEKKFCKRIIGGAIPVFTCNEVTTDEEGYKKVTAKMYYRKNDQFLEVMFLSFNRTVSKLVSDHRELSEKVRSGGFKRDDFLGIIKEYNSWTAKTSN
jgi:tetratricopeptide (TPR) repeat protein